MNNYNEELNRVIEFIKIADAKIGYISTTYFILVGLWVAKFDTIKSHADTLYILYYSFSFFIAALLFIAILQCIEPFLKIKNLIKHSAIYFGDIAEVDINSFKQKRKNLTAQETEDLYLEQIFTTSIIASSKMKGVKKSIRLLLSFSLLTLILYFII